MADILKIYIELLNKKANWLETCLESGEQYRAILVLLFYMFLFGCNMVVTPVLAWVT